MTANHPTVLVTGANGFVGRALCHRLAVAGYRVRGAIRQLGDQQSEPGVEFVLSPDLNSPDADWTEALLGVQVVVHAAARVHVMNPGADHLQMLHSVNTAGTAILAKAAAKAGVRRFVYLSTIKVNGETTNDRSPFRASDSVAPTDPYALSKLKAEIKLQALADCAMLEVVIIRPPLVYGPGAKGNLELLEKCIRKGIPLPVGMLDHNRRSLVSLGNLVSLIEVCVVHPAAANQTFLVSDDDDVSTLRLTRLIAQACARSALVIPVPEVLLKALAFMTGKSDMIRRLTDSLQVDVSPTRQRLGWVPVQSLSDGMLEAFRSPRS